MDKGRRYTRAGVASGGAQAGTEYSAVGTVNPGGEAHWHLFFYFHQTGANQRKGTKEIKVVPIGY